MFIILDYRCGSPEAWSHMFYFTAMPSDKSWVPKFAVYGDLGLVNGTSMDPLIREVHHHNIDVIMHVGQFSLRFIISVSSIMISLPVLCQFLEQYAQPSFLCQILEQYAQPSAFLSYFNI